MKRSRDLILGALLVIVLGIGTWRSVWAMGQRYDRAGQLGLIAAPGIFGALLHSTSRKSPTMVAGCRSA